MIKPNINIIYIFRNDIVRITAFSRSDILGRRYVFFLSFFLMDIRGRNRWYEMRSNLVRLNDVRSHPLTSLQFVVIRDDQTSSIDDFLLRTKRSESIDRFFSRHSRCRKYTRFIYQIVTVIIYAFYAILRLCESQLWFLSILLVDLCRKYIEKADTK